METIEALRAAKLDSVQAMLDSLSIADWIRSWRAAPPSWIFVPTCGSLEISKGNAPGYSVSFRERTFALCDADLDTLRYIARSIEAFVAARSKIQANMQAKHWPIGRKG